MRSMLIISTVAKFWHGKEGSGSAKSKISTAAKFWYGKLEKGLKSKQFLASETTSGPNCWLYRRVGNKVLLKLFFSLIKTNNYVKINLKPNKYL